jgi:protein arginine kinase activator
MKCQRCPKPAVYHITDVTAPGEFTEVHLCEGCAKVHLAEMPAEKQGPPADATELGAKHCDACGIKFVEFRNSGRLGCPHDYDAFREELQPLLENIHGDVKHAGKSPRRRPAARVEAELAGLRKKLQQAVTSERYEDAARLRDEIKTLEGG